GLLLWKAVEPAVGHHVPRLFCRGESGHAAPRSTDSQPVVRSRRRTADPRGSAAARKAGEAVRRTDVLALHPALRHLALRHRDVSRRPARNGLHLLYVPFHLHPSRTARGYHARISRAWRRTDTEDRSQTGGLIRRFGDGATHLLGPGGQRRRPPGSVSG